MSLTNENTDSRDDFLIPERRNLSDDDINPYPLEEQQEMERVAAIGWLVDQNKLFQLVLASPDSGYNRKWTKAYEEKLKRDGKSDEKIRSLKEMDIFGAVHTRMLTIRHTYAQPGLPLAHLSCRQVWIAKEDRTAKKHYCWVFPVFGENSLRRLLMGYDEKRTEALAQFQQDAGIDPSEPPGSWIYVDNSYQQRFEWKQRKEDELRKILNYSLFLGPPDGRGAEAGGSQVTAT